MRDDRREVLEASGWILRVQRHLTQAEVAEAIGSSQSRVAKMEAADPSVSMDLLVRTLLRLGATPEIVASHSH